jgi:hypothetical protein
MFDSGTGTLFDQFDALLTWIKDALAILSCSSNATGSEQQRAALELSFRGNIHHDWLRAFASGGGISRKEVGNGYNQ